MAFIVNSSVEIWEKTRKLFITNDPSKIAGRATPKKQKKENKNDLTGKTFFTPST